MRITMSDGYRHDPCGEGCEKFYCQVHRMLWRACETMERGVDDTYLDGRAHYVYTITDCPECREEDRRKRNDEYRRRYEHRQTSGT